MDINSWTAYSLGAPDDQLLLLEHCTFYEADGSVSASTPVTCIGRLRVAGQFVDESVCVGTDVKMGVTRDCWEWQHSEYSATMA